MYAYNDKMIPKLLLLLISVLNSITCVATIESTDEDNPTKQQLADINQYLTKLTKDVENLTKQVTDIRGENNKLKTEIDSLGQENNKIKKRQHDHTWNSNHELLNDISDDHRQKSIKNDDNIIGFTAYATEATSYVNQSTILFQGVITNDGEAYDPLASEFTCPVSGSYIFSLSLYTSGSREIDAEIVINGAGLVGTYAWDWGVGSVTVVIHCSEGQRVWIRCTYDGTAWIAPGDNGKWSVFSGLLIRI